MSGTGTYTSKADEDFFAAIGRLTISWAHLELGLDLVVDITHRLKLSKELEKPRALQRKISYMRASVKQMSLPEDALIGFENLFSTIEAAAEILCAGTIAQRIRLMKKEHAESIAALQLQVKSYREALEGIQRLFSGSSQFYIKKLGSPMTNGDQDQIDAVFGKIANVLREPIDEQR